MKKLFFLCAALILTFSTVSALAATDVTGSWSAQYTSPDGSVVLNFDCTLKQDDAKLTGSFSDLQDDGRLIVITDGKIDGNAISFKVTYNGVVINFDGPVNGDEIKLASKSDVAEFPGGVMILKRTKSPTSPPAT